MLDTLKVHVIARHSYNAYGEVIIKEHYKNKS